VRQPLTLFCARSYTHRTRGASAANASVWAPYGLAAVNAATADGRIEGIEGKAVQSSCGAPAPDGGIYSRAGPHFWATNSVALI
jgi:hypothetical protein